MLPYLGAAAACCAGLAALAMKPLDAHKRISKATMAGITVLGVALWYCIAPTRWVSVSQPCKHFKTHLLLVCV